MPKPQTTALEIHGRTTLWLMVLHECQDYLKLARRAAAAATDEKRLNLIEGAKAFDAHREAHPDEEARMGFQAAYRGYAEAHPEYFAFPTWSDCLTIKTNNQMLAIVTFYRIWTSGDADTGLAAKNTDGAIQKLRARLVTTAFPLASEREAFERLLESIKSARDEVIAHTSAKRAGIQVDGIATQLKSSSNVVNEVDLDYLERCLPILIRSCSELTDPAAVNSP